MKVMVNAKVKEVHLLGMLWVAVYHFWLQKVKGRLNAENIRLLGFSNLSLIS